MEQKRYQTIEVLEKLRREHDYATIPTGGIVEIVQDELGFVHLTVGVCSENWKSGELIYFIDKGARRLFSPDGVEARRMLLDEWHKTRSVELASKFCEQMWEVLHEDI